MTTALMDQTRTERFANKLVDSLNGAALSLMTSIGHRTGLFDTMSRMLRAATSIQIADESGLSERYVREWLGAMVTGGVVEYDAESRTYSLPLEHAAVLTRRAAPGNIAAMTQWIGVLGSVEDVVVEAFTHGCGVPYSAYNRFTQVMSEHSGQTVVAALEQHILPLVPGLVKRLESGIDVLDVACGAGLAMIELASKYPRSRFSSFDISEQAIKAARRQAAAQGVNNVSFEIADVAEMKEEQAFDLVTAFDAIHDQARPQQVLDNIRRSLRAGGLFLMQDIRASSHVHHNAGHPLGTFIYTISCMHCMSVSLANGGPGLGAAWGKEKALEMLEAAGFDDVIVETLPHDATNYYYIAPV